MNQGEKIKSIRTAKGLTQQGLSDVSGISLRTIQRIENGEVKASLYSLGKLADALEVGLSAFSDDSKVKQSKPSKIMNTLLSFISAFKTPAVALSVFALVSIGIYSLWPSRPENHNTGPEMSIFEVATINCGGATECDIEVTKKDKNGNILWQKTYGGTSYDRAGQVVAKADGGCLLVGSTSSYGAGNYDVLLLNIDAAGNLVWQKTYGGFFNEYGKELKLLPGGSGYLISGTQQKCPGANVSNDCVDNVWSFGVDLEGLEKI